MTMEETSLEQRRAGYVYGGLAESDAGRGERGEGGREEKLALQSNSVASTQALISYPFPPFPQRRRLKAELHNIERQIFDLEGSYLEETLATGNVLRGWDVALNSTSTDAAVAKPIPKKINREVRTEEFGRRGREELMCEACMYSRFLLHHFLAGPALFAFLRDVPADGDAEEGNV